MIDIVREAQGAHLCALFIKAHGDTGDYEYALDAANGAAKHLQVIQAELSATSPLSRDTGRLAKLVRAAQRNLSQQRPADNSVELLNLATSLQRAVGIRTIKETPQAALTGGTGEKPLGGRLFSFRPTRLGGSL